MVKKADYTGDILDLIPKVVDAASLRKWRLPEAPAPNGLPPSIIRPGMSPSPSVPVLSQYPNRGHWSLPTMPWPTWPWSTRKTREEDEPPLPRGRDWNSSLNAIDWSHYTQPSIIIPTVIATATTLFTVHIYKKHLRRIPSTEFIKPDAYRRKSLFGSVTSVGDGDNFRMFHTPGGRWVGWGWAPGRRVPTERKELKEKTVCAASVLQIRRRMSVSDAHQGG